MFGDDNTKIKNQVTKIGQYHYNLFNSAYGSPIYMGLYKTYFLFLIFYFLFFIIQSTVSPLPAFNGVIDSMTNNNRVSFTIYWFPTFIYLCLSIFSISDFLSSTKRMIALFVGIFSILWHWLYFILFWTYPSDVLPSSISDMKPSAGLYWTELFVNLIMVIIQFVCHFAVRDYQGFVDKRFDEVKNDLQKFLCVQETPQFEEEQMPLNNNEINVNVQDDDNQNQEYNQEQEQDEDQHQNGDQQVGSQQDQ